MFDISVFVASGRRFSVDIKLHQGELTPNNIVQYESSSEDSFSDVIDAVSNVIIPRVLELILRSRDPLAAGFYEEAQMLLLGCKNRTSKFLLFMELAYMLQHFRNPS